MEKEIQKETDLQKQDGYTERLIQFAIREKSGIDTLERLIALREKANQQYAREEFFKNLSQLQSELPVIKKNRIIKNKDGSVRYKYADLDSIIKQTKKVIAKYNFSYNFCVKQNENEIAVSCIVSHIAGHSETTTVTVPIIRNTYEGMNNIQVIGASVTYAKRYAFTSAFGIAAMDEDIDANIPEPQQQSQQQKNTQLLQTRTDKMLMAFKQLGINKSEIYNFINKKLDEPFSEQDFIMLEQIYKIEKEKRSKTEEKSQNRQEKELTKEQKEFETRKELELLKLNLKKIIGEEKLKIILAKYNTKNFDEVLKCLNELRDVEITLKEKKYE